MTTLIWDGTTATYIGDWSHAANWKLTNGTASSSIPVNSDDVYFVTGSQDVDASTCSAGVALTSLNFGTKWTGSFVTTVDATSGETTDDEIDSVQIGATYLDFAKKRGYVSLTGTFTTANTQATSTDSPALQFDDCTLTNLKITGGGGQVLVNDGSTVSSVIDMIGCRGVKLEIEAGATVSAADVTIDSGKLLCYEELDTIVQYGGLITMGGVDGTTNSMTVYKGTVKYQPTGSAVLTTLVLYGGYFDMRGCKSPSHTITNATMYTGSMADERNGLSNTTWQNPITSNGAVIKCDLGRSVTVT